MLKLFSTTFSDIPNCENDDGCHDNATCTDTNGSYTCICKPGFVGDGFNCTGNTLLINYVFFKASVVEDFILNHFDISS